uniref:C-type lectin domain-containing protein n=1 Tax=Heliothis virescens TaxID=7102 RepID=A0A2A4J3K2_HELVI
MAVNGRSQYMNVTSCKDSLPYICYRKLDNRTMNECGTFDDAYHLNKRTGSCYKVHLDKKTWYHAYQICAAEGSHLVVINNKEEALVIKDMFPVRPSDKINKWEQFHIGLRAYGDLRTWVTLNGDRLEDVFNDWDPGQPDNGGGTQHHGTFIRAGTLDDGYHGTKAMFVCEKSPKVELFEPSPLQYSEISGDRLEDVFNDWDPGQPDNGGGTQHHGTFIRAGTLDDGYHGTKAMFVCEKSPKVELFEPSPLQYSEISGKAEKY